jgi:hypothetical protein
MSTSARPPEAGPAGSSSALGSPERQLKNRILRFTFTVLAFPAIAVAASALILDGRTHGATVYGSYLWVITAICTGLLLTGLIMRPPPAWQRLRVSLFVVYVGNLVLLAVPPFLYWLGARSQPAWGFMLKSGELYGATIALFPAILGAMVAGLKPPPRR